MKTYRLKPPTFEARQFTGNPNCLVNGFFGWLGESAKVTQANAKSVSISIRQYNQPRDLQVGEWVVRDMRGDVLQVVADDDFRRDFEVNE